jgi:hypothetical protein
MKPIFVCYVEFQDHEQIRYLRDSIEEKDFEDLKIKLKIK